MKAQYPPMIKTSNTPGIERSPLNLIQRIYEIPTANIITAKNWTFYPKIWKKKQNKEGKKEKRKKEGRS